MSLFLHPQNQELLWQSIHKVSIFPSFAKSISSKEQWFREQMGAIYENNPQISTISKEQLTQVNRMVIQAMVETMKNHLAAISQKPSVDRSSLQGLDSNKELSREWLSGQKQDALNSAFLDRQKDYESLLKPTAPTPVSFSETDPDGPIQNMEELMKQHMAERDLLAAPTTIAPPSLAKPKENTISISEESVDLQVSPISSAIESKKRVRFLEENTATDAILAAIAALSSKIDGFSKELESVKSHLFGQVTPVPESLDSPPVESPQLQESG
jgi:hypothetical protein